MKRLALLHAVASIAVLSFSTLVFSAPAARAHDWYILNFETATCETAESLLPEAPTPERFHNGLREDGTADAVKVTRDIDGEVAMVTVTYSIDGSRVFLMWFPAAAICERMRNREIANGSLPDMNDLK